MFLHRRVSIFIFRLALQNLEMAISDFFHTKLSHQPAALILYHDRNRKRQVVRRSNRTILPKASCRKSLYKNLKRNSPDLPMDPTIWHVLSQPSKFRYLDIIDDSRISDSRENESWYSKALLYFPKVRKHRKILGNCEKSFIFPKVQQLIEKRS